MSARLTEPNVRPRRGVDRLAAAFLVTEKEGCPRAQMQKMSVVVRRGDDDDGGGLDYSSPESVRSLYSRPLLERSCMYSLECDVQEANLASGRKPKKTIR